MSRISFLLFIIGAIAVQHTSSAVIKHITLPGLTTLNPTVLQAAYVPKQEEVSGNAHQDAKTSSDGVETSNCPCGAVNCNCNTPDCKCGILGCECGSAKCNCETANCNCGTGGCNCGSAKCNCGTGGCNCGSAKCNCGTGGCNCGAARCSRGAAQCNCGSTQCNCGAAQCNCGAVDCNCGNTNEVATAQLNVPTVPATSHCGCAGSPNSAACSCGNACACNSAHLLQTVPIPSVRNLVGAHQYLRFIPLSS